MLVILDTNVLLSALHAGTGPPVKIVDAWRNRRFALATSSEQIKEFRRAARYPKLLAFLPRGAVGRMVNELRAAEIVLVRMKRAGDSPDPGDDYLLAMSIAAGADYLVTGDKPLLSVRRVGHSKIVTPRAFATLL